MTQPQQNQSPLPQPVGNWVYTCNTFHDGSEWMLAKYETKTGACHWTKSDLKALIFHTEEEVEDMIKLFSLEDCHIGRVTVGG